MVWGLSNSGEGAAQVPFLLAERARSECARSMRAVKGNLATPPKESVGNWKALVGRAQWKINQPPSL